MEKSLVALLLTIVIALLLVLALAKNDQDKKKEVYMVELVNQDPVNGRYTTKQEDAEKVANSFGGTVATHDQLQNAKNHNADWCLAGWVADRKLAEWPITYTLVQGCSDNGGPGIVSWTPGNNMASVNIYGVKPSADTVINGMRAMPFSGSSEGPKKWSMYS